jgi:signal transduction histidine kinase/ligand-binding sensor domain-containing protein/DNA-binding response OmpR family regulator
MFKRLTMPARLATIILLICCFSSQAQQPKYNFARLDIESGLSHNQVQSIYRDSLGLTWFGTNDGLNRFDGYNCKVFTSRQDDSTALADNFILDIFPLPNKRLWINSKLHSYVFNILNEKFDRNYGDFLKKLGMPPGRPKTIVPDKFGNYWFLFEKDGLYRLDAGSSTARRFRYTNTTANAIVYVNVDQVGVSWIALANGAMQRIDPGTMQVTKQLNVLPDSLHKYYNDVKFIIDRQQNFWIWYVDESRGVFKVNQQTGVMSHFHSTNPQLKLNNNLVRGLVQDIHGVIWIGTDHGGVNLVQEADNTNITYLENNEADKSSLSYNSVESLYQDGRGIVWVGTGKKGVNYVNENITQFQLYQHEAGNPASLPYNDINYFVEDKKNNLWIATNGGGLIYFDRAKNTFRQYVNDPANKNSLSNNVIISLTLDHENKLWIGTYTGGLDCFDGTNFTHYRHNPADPTTIADDRIWEIMEDSAHQLWIGTLRGGLDRFDRATKTFEHFHVDGKTPAPLHTNYIPVFIETKDHSIWIGTDVGLEVMSPDRKHFKYIPASNDENGVSYPVIIDMAEDKRGLIWIATRLGLDMFDPATQKFRHFFTSDGLPDNIITNLATDKHDNLWISTPKGVSQLKIEHAKNGIAFSVLPFNESNNLQGKVFGEDASMTTRKGEIVVGGINGFNIIDPEKILVSKIKSNVILTSLEILNNEEKGQQDVNRNTQVSISMPFANDITLESNENSFSIEFVALDFSHNNLYAYRMDGFNKNWLYANNENRRVTYTNLDPGTYEFRVKATNSNGMWEAEEKKLTIVIKTPFWRTVPAILLYMAVIAGVLYLAREYVLERAHMKFEVRQQKMEAERIQTLDAVKTKFFTNVSHEFRTPLSLIVGPLDRLMKHTHEPEQRKQLQLVQRNARRLLNLVNQLLDFRKMEVQEFAVQRTEGEFIAFCRELTCSFSDLAEMKRIKLSFSTNVASFTTLFDRDKVEKIMFNLLSNAFKYTPGVGRIEVSVLFHERTTLTTPQLEISVMDTGIGIPRDKQEQIFEPFFQHDVFANVTNPGSGIGLAITKEFVRLLGGQISLNSEPGAGTTFKVTLPVINATDDQHEGSRQVEEITLMSATMAEERASRRAPATDGAPLILLVEDNEDFRFYLKDNLTPGYRVVETENGQRAWELLETVQPDLIISDVMMPLMDGIELTRRLKADAKLRQVPIVLLTAHGDEELQLESYRLGVNDFMQKPFTYEILAARVENILQQRAVEPIAPGDKQYAAIQPTEVEVTPAGEQFLEQVVQVIEQHIGETDFSVEALSKELFMHRAGMYRKLLAITGKTPIEVIREVRLKRGAQLIERSGMTIAEVAYDVGFNNPKKFSQYFKEYFNMTPSEYQKTNRKIPQA